ncbi:MAG: hypothetical protein Q8Q35_01000 [Nanoarchaeota archaeon]|nr:hypothetical protein [Nanoarchaeota archaeon]
MVWKDMTIQGRILVSNIDYFEGFQYETARYILVVGVDLDSEEKDLQISIRKGINNKRDIKFRNGRFFLRDDIFDLQNLMDNHPEEVICDARVRRIICNYPFDGDRLFITLKDLNARYGHDPLLKQVRYEKILDQLEELLPLRLNIENIKKFYI